MSKQQTVFILGAGASEHYGYPTGEGLRDKIIAKFEGWYIHHILEPNYYKPWEDIDSDERSLATKQVRAFIKDFDKSHDQIDLFITRRSLNEEYTRLGKLAIILGIIESEWETDNLKDNKGWYRELLNQITEGRTDPDDFRISQNTNKVSFITFNYDRSLEHYLYTTLQDKFGADSSDVSKEINKISIVHIYGMIAALEWQDNPANIFQLSYNINKNMPLGNDAWKMSKNIIVRHNNRDNPNVEKCKKLLRQANRVYFLGFGYLRDNMKRLDIPNTIYNARKIYGTALGFPPPLVESLKRNYFSNILRDKFIENNMKCRELLYTYPLATD